MGGGGVGGVGAHRVVERGVPTPQGHAQGPPDTLRTPTRRLTNAPRLSPPVCGTWSDEVGGGWVTAKNQINNMTESDKIDKDKTIQNLSRQFGSKY